MIKAVLFDMDGVLVCSEPIIREAAKAALKLWGVEAQDEDFLPFIGAGEDRFVGGVAQAHGVPYVLEMKNKAYEIYLSMVDERIEVYDGVHEVIQTLKGMGLKIAVCSSADRIKVEANLKAAKLPMEWFDCIVTGSDIINKKPDPEVFIKGAKGVGVKPEFCAVIEDALNGIEAAKAAGMKAIGITTSFTREKLMEACPYAICDSIKDIVDIITV